MTLCEATGRCTRASGQNVCIFCRKPMDPPALSRAYKKALAAAAKAKKAVFTGWTCVSGPSDLVHFLVDNGESVTYQMFTRNVDLSTADLDPESRKMLKTDYHVTFLRTKLPSGALAWVMQHSHIEHLFLAPGTHFDPTAEAALIP